MFCALAGAINEIAISVESMMFVRVIYVLFQVPNWLTNPRDVLWFEAISRTSLLQLVQLSYYVLL